MESPNLQTAMAVIESAISTATPTECPALLGELEKLKGQVLVRLMNGHGEVRPTASAERLLTPAQVAERLSVKESFVYEICRQGKLGSVRMGKYVRVAETALAQYQAALKN